MPRPPTPAAKYKKVMLRIPEDLLAQAKALADQEERSVNTQLVRLIREALAAYAPQGDTTGGRTRSRKS